ncbi:unnamed protein product, partial [Larinioides sclopetarius]
VRLPWLPYDIEERKVKSCLTFLKEVINVDLVICSFCSFYILYCLAMESKLNIPSVDLKIQQG